MKKILLLVAVLLGTVTANAQYSAQVKVTVKNSTAYNLYFSPRYSMAFFDGTNNYSFFGTTNAQLGISASTPTKDFDYKQEGVYEQVLLSGQSRTYGNNAIVGGYPFYANSSFPTFNLTGPTMIGAQTNPSFFYKYMGLDWIKFAFSTSSLNASFYSGGIGNPVPSGFSQITTSPPIYIGPYNQMVTSPYSSTIQFTYNGVTIYGVWTITNYVPGQDQAVTIVFYQ
jgi:hypothetical protein